VDLKTLPKVPKDPRMLSNNGGVPLGRQRSAKPGTSMLSWTTGSKTKMTDGRSVLTRARREAKEIQQRNRMVKPLMSSSGQIRKAPPGMVSEYRKGAETPIRILTKKRPSISSRPSGRGSDEKEGRLRALITGSKTDAAIAVKETLVASSDEEEEEDNKGIDDMFGEPRQPAFRPSSKSAPRPPAFKTAPASSPTRKAHQSSSSPFESSNSGPKPSEIISSFIPRPKAPSTSALLPPTSSPAPRSTTNPVLARKRPEVDIFMRKPAKKPRVR